jgi:hypothetical protein
MQVACTCSIKCSMDIQHRHEAWPSSMDMQHGGMVMDMDMQNEHTAWTYSIGMDTHHHMVCNMDMGMQH